MTPDPLLEHVDDSIRPQDDLFGHVNGAWFDTAEIPADLPTHRWVRRPHPGVRGGGRRDPSRGERRVRRRALLAPAAIAGRSATCSPASWTRIASRRSVTDPLADDLAAIAALRDLPGLAELARPVPAGGPRRRRRVLRQHRRPALGPLHRQPRPRRARPARRGLLPRGRLRRAPGEVRRARGRDAAPDRAIAAREAERRGRAADGARDPARRRPLGQRPLPRRAGDLQPHDARRAARRGARVRLAGVDQGHGRHRGASSPRCWCASPATCRRCRRPLTEVPLEDWKIWLTFHLVSGAAPYLSRAFVDEHFDFYRPHAHRRRRSSGTAGSAASTSATRPSAKRSAPSTSRACCRPKPRRRWTSWSPICSRRTASASAGSNG